MDLLKTVCSLPTAPFAESHVVQFVRDFIKARKNLTLSQDRFGNLLIQLKSKSKLPRWVFTAHMDHPGFVAEQMADRHHLRAAFRGWVKIDYVQGTRVRFFDGKNQI